MTMPIHFDTFEYIKLLTEAGVPQDQAEAQMQALREVMAGGAVAPVEMVIQKTALLERVDRFKQELDAKLDNFKLEFDAKLDRFRCEFDAKLDKFDARLDNFKLEFNARLDKLGGQITSLRWLLILSLGTSILSLGVSLLTLSKLLALHP